VGLFTSLGPHKSRELSLFAGVPYDLVSQWAEGTARPDRQKERSVRHYLVSKLADIEQLEADHKAQGADMVRARAKITQASKAWDTYIEGLREKDVADSVIKSAEGDKAKALDKLCRQLGLISV